MKLGLHDFDQTCISQRRVSRVSGVMPETSRRRRAPLTANQALSDT